MEDIFYYEYQTPIGILTLGCIENNIVLCAFGYQNIQGRHEETVCLKNAFSQLLEYFEGKRQYFDLTYRFLKGTVFQQSVWKELLKIPYGEIRTYQDIAKKVGSPHAYRAVGHANHCNPIAIFIPCHRVIGTSHHLTGYAGGLNKKIFLLELENNHDWKE